VIYLDMDGVLADFDKTVTPIIGENHYKFSYTHGDDALWKRLNMVPNLFERFDKMPDADVLWEAVAGRPVRVLTAVPKTNAEEVARQKRTWIKRNFGEHVPVITCRSFEKPNYAEPGDVLVDDRNVNQDAWERKGGVFVHHINAFESIEALKQKGII
jgi:hypothetical protein